MLHQFLPPFRQLPTQDIADAYAVFNADAYVNAGVGSWSDFQSHGPANGDEDFVCKRDGRNAYGGEEMTFWQWHNEWQEHILASAVDRPLR